MLKDFISSSKLDFMFLAEALKQGNGSLILEWSPPLYECLSQPTAGLLLLFSTAQLLSDNSSFKILAFKI